MLLFYIIFGIFCLGWIVSIVMDIVSRKINNSYDGGWLTSIIVCCVGMAIANIIFHCLS